jgi:hypothetical protein
MVRGNPRHPHGEPDESAHEIANSSATSELNQKRGDMAAHVEPHLPSKRRQVVSMLVVNHGRGGIEAAVARKKQAVPELTIFAAAAGTGPQTFIEAADCGDGGSA